MGYNSCSQQLLLRILQAAFSIIVDIRKGNGLATLFNAIHTIFGSVILNKQETNIAQVAMVIMRLNEIEFTSIITIQVGECLIPMCSTKDKI